MRNQIVAGQFYPLSPENLKESLTSFLSALPTSESLAVVSPHAGYIYSGQTAAYSFSNLGPADTYILLGPSHTGMGSELSVSTQPWQTPLGQVQPDTNLAQKIISSTSANHDELAHQSEHSLEVQLPFLQHLHPGSQIVPICMMQTSFDPKFYESFGTQLAKIIKSETKTIRIIASSDFSHFVPEAQASEQDHQAIQFIQDLDTRGFLNYVHENQISICGYGPIATAISISKTLGIKKAELLKYDTSASRTGDTKSVVGYASITFQEKNDS